MAAGIPIYKGTAIEDNRMVCINYGDALTGYLVRVYRRGAKVPAIVRLDLLNKGMWVPVAVNADTLRLIGHEDTICKTAR